MRFFIVILSISLILIIETVEVPGSIKNPFNGRMVRVPQSQINDLKPWLVIGSFSLGAYAIFMMTSPFPDKCVCRIDNFEWNLNDFCRGWLITGKTGSGKTASAMVVVAGKMER